MLNSPLIYAHRGVSDTAIEHTKEAYITAIKQGADGFECDVRLTADEEIICFHDATTKRTHNVDLRISSTSFAELNAKTNPLLFSDLLEMAINNQKNLAIEFKHPVKSGPLIEKRVQELLSNRAGDIKRSGIKISLMSFSWFATQRNMKTNFDHVYLIKSIRALKFLNAGTAGLSINLIREQPDLVSKLHNNGKQVFAWTVNEISDLKLCQKLDVEVVITDNPARACEVLR
jgi:glycerophosphoryl diester phosphodiesterase